MTYQDNRPQNYTDVNDGSLAEKIIRGVLKTRCECGRFVHAFRIVDTRGLPDEVTKGQQWACDGCWTGWIRHDPRHQRSYQGRPFRELDWLELHGAPSRVIANQIARDAATHARLVSHRGQVRAMGKDDARDRELARIDEIIFRRVDAGRLG